MAFTKEDIKRTMELIGFERLRAKVSIESIAVNLRQQGTPCNCCFISFNTYGEWSKRNVEVLFAAARLAARNDRAPTFGLSVSEKESAYKAIMKHIKGIPRFQTITTGSRHGRYKVVWVVGRADGRAFPQPKNKTPFPKGFSVTGEK